MSKEIQIRGLAHDLLFRIDRDRAYADRLIDATIRRYTLNGQDAGFLTELTLGTCRWQLWLDAQLRPFLNRPIKNTTRGVRWALRLGAYEILKMRTPSHAAVDEAVTLIRDKRQRGFVNAVLRKVASLDEPAHLDDWGARHSHPKWLIDEARVFLKSPAGVEAWLSANNEIADTFVRLRDYSLDEARDTFDLSEVMDAPQCARLSGSPEALVNSDVFRAGKIVIQDLASQLVVSLAPTKGRKRIWDMCAAPGSKTIQLADQRDKGATLLATELHPHRVELLNEGLKRAGISDALTLECDASQVETLDGDAFKQPFDLILLDAPCSGLGTVQRHPELKYVRPEDSLEDLQRKLLSTAFKHLDVGGVLVYSLCTFRSAETDSMVHWMLEQHPELKVITPELPAGASPHLLTQTAEGHPCVRTWSHQDGCDSFFWVGFERSA